MSRSLFIQVHFHIVSTDRTAAHPAAHVTEVHFASFLSGGITTMAVINPPEKKLANRTSVHCLN